MSVTEATSATLGERASKSSAASAYLIMLMLLSGFAGLGYEIVWTKMLSVALGHEIVAVLAVIGAFFAGLGIGAFFLDGPIRASRMPGRWYAALEIVIGAWALVLIALVPVFNDFVPGLIGADPSPVRHWSVAFVATFALLLPATAAMGGTLPAMERLYSRLRRDGWDVGGLYAANTFGAVLGTLVTTFWVAPVLGYAVTLAVLAAVNFLCAAGVLATAARGEAERPPVAATTADPPPTRILAALLLATGLIGIGYEVVVIRALGEMLENTVFTFANLLAVYLAGTALGAALYQRYAPRRAFEAVLSVLMSVVSAACLAGVAILWVVAPLVVDGLAVRVDGYLGAISVELLLAGLVFLFPTIAMGATFAHLAQVARDSFGVGRALGLNTLGAAFAPVLFGVVLLPVVGSKLLLIASSAAYLLLIPLAAGRLRLAIGPATAAILMLAIPAPLRYLDVPAGGEILSYRQGVMGSVSVVEDAEGIRFLKVNNHYTMGSSASGFSDRRQAHLPLLLHPDPESALFLGLGTGSTFAAVAEHPDLAATAIELVPEILPAIQHFGPSAAAYAASDRLHLKVSDARRFVQASDAAYDVIVAEVFHPSRDGAGSLYTVEHFEAIRERLSQDGLFCQWLPLFQLDLETLRTIVRTFLSVYPDTEAYLAHFSLGQPLIALVGRQQDAGYRRGWLNERVRDRRLAEDLTSVRIATDFDLFGGFLGSAETLSSFASDGPLNTDDRPVVTYRAPRFVYSAPEPSWVRLLALIDELEPDAGDLFENASVFDQAFMARLEDYWRARNAYLAAGVGIQPSTDVEAMLAQVAEPLLSVVRISDDFAPAYVPLLEMAYELREINPQASRRLLLALEQAGPERGEAADLRRRLFGP